MPCDDTVIVFRLSELMLVQFAKSILTWHELVPSRISVINTPRVERIGACARLKQRISIAYYYRDLVKSTNESRRLIIYIFYFLLLFSTIIILLFINYCVIHCRHLTCFSQDRDRYPLYSTVNHPFCHFRYCYESYRRSQFYRKSRGESPD